jgi:benzylsuccinate CoA-transferase BbsF subunit
LRVVEFTLAWAGPACGELLADFGADVVKVETSTRPDVSRTVGPFPSDTVEIEASGYFMEWNRNKRSIDLNLRDPADQQVALQLAARADVVIENFAPGVLDRLGLGYEVIRSSNPAVIMLSISGFGATGPDRAAVAYGQQIEAECGLMSVTGYADGDPSKPGISYPDPVAAIAGVTAVVAAVLHRDRTGEGQWIDLSMLETSTTLMSEPLAEFGSTGSSPTRHGNASPYFAPHGIYPCSGEDQWIAIECHDESEWRALANLVGEPSWTEGERYKEVAARLRNREMLDERLGAWTVKYRADPLASRLQAAGVRAAKVMDIAELADDPHLNERGYWTCFEHPRVGSFFAHGALTRLERTPARLRRRPPLLGEHSDEIRQELADG